MTHTETIHGGNSLLEKIFSLLARAGKAVIAARQREANNKIVDYIAREYPGEPREYILQMLNEGRADELFK